MPFKVTAPFILKGFFYKSCKKRVKTSKMSKEIMESTNETAPKKYIPDRGKPSLRTKVANTLSVLLMGASHMVGCTPSPSPEKTDPSSSTSPQVSVETNPDTQSETSIPAPMSTEEGSSIEITSSSYPSNEENFILNDQRTNQEKTDVIESVAPDDYQKEANLLGEEWKRMGKDESDLEIVASIVDGKSWVLVAKSKSGGQVFVPKINGVIQASLHLFGRLDETGDFFDLVPVAMENATVVGDESGWHVVAQVKDGEVSQWYDATKDEIKMVEVSEPSPTPDARFQDLLPETLAEVEQKNVLRWDHLEEDLATLLEKEKEVNMDSTKIEPFTTGIPKMDTEKLKAPSFITLHISNNGEQNPIVSVSYLDKGLWVLGIAAKRPGSEEVGILHVAIDENAMKQIYKTGGYDMEAYEKYSKMESIYPKIQNGEFSEISLGVILYRGYAEEGGVWDPLLDLLPTEDLNDEYYYYVGDLKKAAHSDDEEARRIFSYFNDKILPCVSIGVIY